MDDNKKQYERLRLGAGLTDYSKYQVFELSGAGATTELNRVSLGDVTRLPIGRVLATYMLNEDGTLLADVLLWNQGGRFMILAETKQAESLAPFIAKHAPGAMLKDLAPEICLLGIDGPFAWEVLKELVGVRILGLRYLETMSDQKIGDISTDIIRAGKTGEYGYILKCRAEDGAALAARLLEAGKPFEVAHCNSDVLDLCKLENRFTNVFKEGAAAKNVLELNCRVQVSSEKGDYVGREAVENCMEQGVSHRLIGLTIASGKVPAEGSTVSYKGEDIGKLVSAGFSWTLDSAIGLALLSHEYSFVGCDYDVAGEKAKTVSAPFVLNKSIQIRPQEDSFKSVDWSFKP
jgi:aminomethyltransferase